jgi:hypothetical protein
MTAMGWLEQLNGDPLPWLLEADSENPGPRWFALVDLLDAPAGDPEALAARRALMESGPVQAILAAQDPQGFWDHPGPGYWPKYRSTIWQVIFLAQLGADGRDPGVRKGVEYVLAHDRSTYGGFSADGRPSGMIHCLQGNLAAAAIDLGWLEDERVQCALDWLARSITGEGISPAEEKDAPSRYYKSGNCGPGFACAANAGLPCAWGAVKDALALGRVPAAWRTPAVEQAIDVTRDFLLSTPPAGAGYPSGYSDKPSQSWFRFGYPLAYVTDVLQTLEALALLGCAGHPLVGEGAAFVLGKQDAQGRWKMEYSYNGKTWVDVEEKGRPSKWVTLRALRVVKQVYEAHQTGGNT